MTPLTAQINRLTTIIDQRVNSSRAKAFTLRCENTKNGVDLFRNIRALSSYKRRTPISDKMNIGDASVTSTEDKCNAFVKHYANIHQQASLRGDQQETQQLESEMCSRYDHRSPVVTFSEHLPASIDEIHHNEEMFTTSAEVISYVRSLNNKKSAGHDGIPNWLIRKMPHDFFVPFATLLNQCTNICYFPEIWKIAIIYPILKPGKDKRQIVSYRPISLLPNMSKLLERVIKTRMEAHTEKERLIPNTQFGFRPRTSTEHALFVTNSLISQALNRRETVLALSVDTEKAFDSVWTLGLVSKLETQRFRDHLIRMILSFTQNRCMKVKISDTVSEQLPIVAGVPQGAILSPLLYNLYIADMPSPDTTNIQSIQFADDHLMLAWGDTKDATDDLSTFANSVNTYCDYWKIRINPEKCELLKISGLKKRQSGRTRRLTKNVNIAINNVDVKQVQSFKYLGIEFNEKYCFGQQSRNVLSKANKVLGSLKHLFGKKQIAPEVKKTMYKALIRPTMTYAFSSWSTISSFQMEELRKKERNVLRKFHASHGRKRDSFHYINNKDLYDQTEISRFDRVAHERAVKFLSNLGNSDNALITEHAAVTRRNGDHFKHPNHIIWENEAGTAFNNEGELIMFHRRRNNQLVLTYNMNQNIT